MQHATQCLSVVNNVLNLHNLLLYDTWIDITVYDMNIIVEHLNYYLLPLHPLISLLMRIEPCGRVVEYTRYGSTTHVCTKY